VDTPFCNGRAVVGVPDNRHVDCGQALPAFAACGSFVSFLTEEPSVASGSLRNPDRDD